MFANFEKAFFQKKEIDKKIPEEILKSLSEKLPEGFVYTSIGDSAVGITPMTSEVKIQGLSIKFPENLPEDFKPTTWNEFTEFMYRTQSKIKLNLDKDNCITINNTRFNIEEFIDFPFSDNKFKDIQLFMIPKPFQPPFHIHIEGNGVYKTLTIQRQPYQDMHKSLFKSINDSAFGISYIIDEKEHNLEFNFKTNIEKAESIHEVVEVLKLYHSFIKGYIKLNGEQLPKPDKVELEDESIVETINFWEKVLILQDLLKVKFLPEPQTKFEDVILIEELYRSLYENRPFKEYINIQDLTLNGFQGNNIEDLINAEGFSFQFIQNYKVKLLSVEFEIYSVIAFFDIIVKDVEMDSKEDKTKLIIKPMEGKKIYQSTIHFCSQEEANNYRNNNNIKELYESEILTINN